MEASRYIENIKSDVLTIKVGKYLGKQVEIIILPLEPQIENLKEPEFQSAKAALHKYANPALIGKEKTAWQETLKGKHAIS